MNKSFPSIFALSLFLSALFFNDVTAQSAVQARIKQVENNLTENLQTDDKGPMNLQKRMEHYKVNGLSIAVIKNYKIDWVTDKNYCLIVPKAIGLWRLNKKPGHHPMSPTSLL